jgi:hypothetical protein
LFFFASPPILQITNYYQLRRKAIEFFIVKVRSSNRLPPTREAIQSDAPKRAKSLAKVLFM